MSKIILRTCYSDEINEKLAGKKVRVAGWVHTIREHGNIKFLILRDRTGNIQITASKERVGNIITKISSLGKEDVILVEGVVKKEKKAPTGVEIIPEKIDIISKSQPLPLDFRVKTGLNKRLNYRVIDLRKPEVSAIFKIQSKLVEGMVEYLREKGFIQVFTPCLIGAASESGAEVFPVLYYDKEAFLRQDPQLHRELLILAGFDSIFDLGPSWRAEPSHTTRHLSEYFGCAVELGFIKDERSIMRVEEELIVNAIKKVKKDCREELRLLNKEIKIPKTPFPELKFPEIYDILRERGKKIKFGEDYDRESEMLLSEYVKDKYKSEFFFVNRFPSKAKPFYVMKVDEDPKWARSVDLLFKGLELSSGGQREHRYTKLVEQIKEKGMKLENMKWFTEFFRYGAPPMGGFNIGIERLTMQLLDLENIREASLFPRAPERLLP